MKKTITILTTLFIMSMPSQADDVMTKSADGTYIVNTKTLCNARGYRAQTPVEVHIKDGKVVKVVPMKNQESKGYFVKVTKALLPKYENLKLSKAKKLTEEKKIDGITGATYSTTAIQKNIRAALDYYSKNK